MGGKAKQANRTKNNVRPSSSGRSAELIANKVNPSLVLVGPGKLLPAVFPSLNTGLQESPLSNEFLLCFKKFHKKDPITKVKALNELKDLVANSKQEEVVNALQSWAHYYPSLTVDIDRKVREVTQVCHGAIVRKCGRQVALHIKRLLPAWLLAQHDDFAPAQCVAERDLNTTFPNDKLTEAIKFCKLEIYNLLMENLKGNTGYMLSGQKIDDEEEKEAQAARVTGCSLRSLELFLRKLGSSQADWLWDALLPLLCANSYWKLAGHKSPFVRSSWYLVTGGAIEQFAERLPAELGRRAACTLLAHPEREAAAVAERWLAVYKLMRSVDTATTLLLDDYRCFLENDSLLIKRLFDTLENAAWGAARRLAALVPALLARLPPAARDPPFYRAFFGALLAGLGQKKLLSMKSEREEWSRLIAECLRRVAEWQQGDESVAALLGGAHRAWLHQLLGALLTPDSKLSTALIKCSATHMAGLVKHWLNQAEDGNQVFDQIVRNFWQNIRTTMLNQANKIFELDIDPIPLLEGHTLFIMTLKTAFASGAKKKHNIKFEDDSTEVSETPPDTIECNEATTKRFRHNLFEVAEQVIAEYFHNAIRFEAIPVYLPHVMTLIKEFQSEQMFTALAKDSVEGAVTTPFNLYERELNELLKSESRCREVVEVVFIMTQYLNEQEQSAVFDSFSKMPFDVIEWGISMALSHPYRSFAAVKAWMRSSAVDSAVLALSLREDDAAARDLLLAALSHHDDAELLISDAAINGLITMYSEKINSLMAAAEELPVPLPKELVQVQANGGLHPLASEFERLEPRVQLAAALLRALPAPPPPCCHPLLLSLLRLTLRIPRGSPLLSTERWLEARRAWCSGAAALAAAERALFLRGAVRAVHWRLMHNLAVFSVPRVEHTAALAPLLALDSARLPPRDPAPLVRLSRSLLAVPLPEHVPNTPLDEMALGAGLAWGAPSVPRRDENALAAGAAGARALRPDAVLAHAYCTLFRAMYVRAVLLRTRYSEDGQTETGTWCGEMLRVPYFKNQFCEMLYDCAVLNVINQYYSFWRYFEVLRTLKEQMDAVVRDIVSEVPPELNEEPSADVLAYEMNLRDVEQFHKTALENEWDYSRGILEVKKLMEKMNAKSATRPDVTERPDETLLHTLKFRAMKYGYHWVYAYKYYKDVWAQVQGARLPEQCKSPELDISSYVIVDKNGDNAVSAISNVLYKFGSPEIPELTPSDFQWLFCALEFYDSHSDFNEMRSSIIPVKAEEPRRQLLGTSFIHELQMKAATVIKQRQEAEQKLKDGKLNDLKTEEGNGESVEYDEELVYIAKSVVMLRNYYYVCQEREARAAELLREFTVNNAKCALDVVINGYYRFNETCLYDMSAGGREAWGRRAHAAATLDLLLELVTSRGWAAPAQHWDFANITLCAVLGGLASAECQEPLLSMQAAMVARPALQLYCAVRRFVRDVPARAQREQPSAHVAALPREWADIFAPDLTRSLYHLVYAVLKNSKADLEEAEASTLQLLVEAAEHIDAGATAGALQSSALTPQRLAGAALAALQGVAHRGFQYLACRALCDLAPACVELDVAVLTARPPVSLEDEEKDKTLNLTINMYEKAFHHLQRLVDAILSNYEVCTDICEVAPWTDSHSLVLGYLLLARAALRHAALAAGDLAQLYVAVFNKQEYAEGIMATAVRLLPARVAAHMHSAAPASAFPRDLLPCFERPPAFTLLEACNSEVISSLACYALRCVLGGPGAASARGYWSALPAPRAHALQRLLPPAIAPALVSEQLRRAQEAAAGRALGPDVTITCNAAEMWASCTLEVDERELSMRVTYCDLHPLHAPRVACAPADPHWLSVYLGYKNGDLVEAMRMWVAGVGRSLEGARRCCVCYCRLHPEDGSAPAVPCPQCRNTFHSACLRRWFRTSNRSNCPVCRTNF